MPHNTPQTSPRASFPPKYQLLTGHYPSSNLLFEHSLTNGQLTQTKIFTDSGALLHQLNLSSGQVTNYKIFTPDATETLSLSTYSQSTNTFEGSQSNNKGQQTFKGLFRNGKRNGFGIEYNDQGLNICDGIWKDD